ncbi:MAG: DUF4450 domain-containing protein [Bacteroidota bacterium]|nr:DUF4450 domain-containing protein [Bacteroidota bacterium]
MKSKKAPLLLLLTGFVLAAFSQSPKTVILRQEKDGSCVLSQFGTNFGFFMPETGGYLYTGLILGDKSLWLYQADQIKVTATSRGWKVRLTDPMLGKGELTLQALPLTACNGLILKVEGKQLPAGLRFLWAYGGCSGKSEAMEKTTFFQPEQCLNNVFSREINAFTVYFGPSMHLKVMMGVAPVETETRLSDAGKLTSPLAFWESGKKTDAPAMSATNDLISDQPYYYCIYRQNQQADYNYDSLPALFDQELSTKTNKTHEEALPHTNFGPDFHF